jgi:metal-responsive CopG/Arc/MetJ family transcriptional regulator
MQHMPHMYGMTQTQTLAIRISEPLLELLDEARRKERDIPGRAEMIRRLIERASPQQPEGGGG